MKKRGWQGLGLGSILICLGHVGLDPVFVQFASVGDPDQPKGGSVAVIMPGFDKTLTINIRYSNCLFVMVDLGMREIPRPERIGYTIGRVWIWHVMNLPFLFVLACPLSHDVVLFCLTFEVLVN